MKIILGILAVLIVAGSLVADYMWRQWMTSRAKEDDPRDGSLPGHRRDRP